MTLAANTLATAWDQNSAFHQIAPGTATLEKVALDWLRDLLGLPEGISGGFVTGATMANATALAVARHRVLADAGWDVEADGLFGAPRSPWWSGARSTPPCASRWACWGSGRRASPRWRWTDRGGCAPMRSRAWRGRRSSSFRRATSTPAPSTRSARSSRAPTTSGPGSTSTAPSGCGRRPARRCVRSPRAWSWPIPGRRTSTSGSTCPTTPASRSRAIPRRMPARWR